MDISDALLDAIAFVESNNNAEAVNKTSGARGMYQFMPIGWKDVQQNRKDLAKYGYEDYAFDPEVARNFARALLELNAKRLGPEAGLAELLGSYNWGIGNVKKKGMSQAPAETQNYINKVIKYMAENERE